MINGFSISHASLGLRGGLAQVTDGLLPALAAYRVVSEPLRLLRETASVQRLDHPDDPRVQRAPPLLEQTAVGYFVGEGMLERVLEVGEEAGLVEQLRTLQAG